MAMSLSFFADFLTMKQRPVLAAKLMQNPNDVTTQAFDGLVQELCTELGVTDNRLYEILGKDNPYPKLWRLLTPLGRVDADRLELVRADFNARCDRITLGRTTLATAETVHKEFSEAFQLTLKKCASNAERRQAIAEAITELSKLHQQYGGAE